MKNAAHHLLQAFGFYANSDPDQVRLSREVFLVNWEKAENTEAPDELSSADDYWKLFLNAGFNSQRVLELVDPAIQPIIERMLALPILTINSCSGHPDPTGRDVPYIALMFREQQFGKDFLGKLKKQFQSQELEIRPGVSMTFGTLGPNLELDWCLKKGLPLNISWNHGNAADYRKIWFIVSIVLDMYDNKGKYWPELEQLEQRGADGFGEEDWKRLEEVIARRDAALRI